MMPIYRKAMATDLEAICSIVHAAVRVMEQQQIFQWDDQYPTKADFQEDLKEGALYVGRVDEQIAVLYTLNQKCEEEYETGKWRDPKAPFYVLHRLCVNPIFQNRGIAKSTLQHIEKQVIQMGAHDLRLDAFSENPFALRLYRSMGYTQVGHVDWRMGRFLLMEKHF